MLATGSAGSGSGVARGRRRREDSERTGCETPTSGRATLRPMWRLAVALTLGFVLLPAAARADFGPPQVVGASGGGMFRFPQAIAYDASGVADPAGPPGPYVYVADQYSFLVQKFTAGGTFVRQFGGYGSDPGRFGATSPNDATTGTTGVVGGIGGLAVGPGGDVYVLDSLNDRVELFSAAGEFKRTVAGDLDTGINGGIAVEGDALYVADQNHDRVQRFTLGTDGAPVLASSFGGPGTAPGQFDLPQGIAVDPEGDHDVFVADDRNHRVQRFSAAGTFEATTGTFGSDPSQFKNPYDVSVNHSDQLFVADNQNHRVQQFQASTFTWQAQFGGLGTAPSQLANVRSLSALAATPSGGVYVGDTSNDAIDEFGVGGAFVRTWGRSGRVPGQFTLPRSVAIGAGGVVLVADTRNDRIERLRPDGSAIDVWGKLSTLGYPTLGNGPKEFRDPTGVAVDPASGEVWTTEGGNHRVQRFTADGTWRATYGGTAAGDAPGQFTEPLGIAVGPAGEVLVADTRNDRVQRRDPVTGAWSVLPGSFDRPSAVAVGADGRRYVAEAGANRVRVLRPDGSTQATIDGLHAPEGVAVDAAGRVIVADTQLHRVLRYVPGDGGYVPDAQLGGRGSDPGSFILPIGVAVDGAGAILVVDTYNHRLQRFAPVAAPSTSGSAPSAPSTTAGAPSAPGRATVQTRLAPRALRLAVRPRRDRRAPYRFTVSVRLLRPASVGAAAGCRGQVSVHVGRRERVARLRRDCTLRVVVRLPRSTRRGRARVRATFTGNAALEARAARPLVVRVG
jgi:sugar lactone lactonase YvrE